MFQPLKQVEDDLPIDEDVLQRLLAFNLDSYGVGARFEK